MTIENKKKTYTYVTFGQIHRHVIDGIIFDKDCVAVIEASSRKQGREKAFEIFGRKFCFEYFEDEFDRDILKHFPRGLVHVN